MALRLNLAETGAAPSLGSVGDANDNAMAESKIGLYKTELIKPGEPWCSIDQVQLRTRVDEAVA